MKTKDRLNEHTEQNLHMYSVNTLHMTLSIHIIFTNRSYCTWKLNSKGWKEGIKTHEIKCIQQSTESNLNFGIYNIISVFE